MFGHRILYMNIFNLFLASFLIGQDITAKTATSSSNSGFTITNSVDDTLFTVRGNGVINGFTLVPVGAIIPWVKDLTNTPSLPEGWVECNGQTLSDTESVYDGQTIPDLNSSNRFLRGNTSSGNGNKIVEFFSEAIFAKVW